MEILELWCIKSDWKKISLSMRKKMKINWVPSEKEMGKATHAPPRSHIGILGIVVSRRLH